MPVDYAEPQQLQNFRIDVLPANSNTPILTKSANSAIFDVVPAPPGQLAVPNRNSDLGRPSNMPERQTSLRNDGQYRTIDVTPRTTAASPQPKQNNQLSTLRNNSALRVPNSGATGAVGGEQAMAEAAYYSGFAIVGFWDGLADEVVDNSRLRWKRTPLEDMSYGAGGGAGNATREALKNGKKVVEDLWRKRPTFEIPQIKIPSFDRPELPEFKIPDFPEFKFPEISFPKPQPLPKPPPTPTPMQVKTIWDEFREKNSCRSHIGISFSIVRDAETGEQLEIVPGLPNHPRADVLWAERLGGRLEYRNANWNATENYSLGADYTPDGYGSSILVQGKLFQGCGISVALWTGAFTDGSLDKYLSSLPGGGNTYKIEFYESTNCPLPQLQPPPPPPDLKPPPPPPEDDCCRMGCCPKPTEIDYRLIKRLIVESLKEQKFSINVPVCKCEFNQQLGQWEPKTSDVTLEVFATSKEQAEQVSKLHIENARQAADLCLARNETEVYASVPDYWQTRSFQKPQLAIQYAEDLGNNKIGRSRWCLHIPHYNKPKEYKPNFPKYTKGNIRGILVLNDNSKIIVHCKSDTECLRVINSLKQYVDARFLEGIKKPETTKCGKEYKEALVIPTVCQFFPTGQKDTVPTWSKKLRQTNESSRT